MGDPFSLSRFVNAQDADSSYDDAVRELKRGRKTSHWMWFVFPQLAGLGRTAMAQMYALSGLKEAKAYLAHPVLGPRLRDVAGILAALDETDPVTVLGPIDAMKLRSSMTLFSLADPDDSVFRRVLDRYFSGELDEMTIRLLDGR
jgi:uncharacterized protein (DUF1810 family)